MTRIAMYIAVSGRKIWIKNQYTYSCIITIVVHYSIDLRFGKNCKQFVIFIFKPGDIIKKYFDACFRGILLRKEG